MSNEVKKITRSTVEVNKYIDYETGEVKGESSKESYTMKVSKEPPFVKLYLDHLSRFKGTQLSLNPILAQMLQKSSYADDGDTEGGMVLYLNKPLKADIAKKCGLSLTRVDHAVTEFVKKGYMRRLDLGKYQFNPYLFGKGEWKDIENIRATFDYGTGEAVAEIVKTQESELNKAYDDITSQVPDLPPEEIYGSNEPTAEDYCEYLKERFGTVEEGKIPIIFLQELKRLKKAQGVQ